MLQIYKNKFPAISVVMPALNRVELIKRSINSLFQQTFGSWELIFVDDGSSDNTFEVVSGYIAQAENIKYIRHSNRGLPLSRNAGIMASIGKYITFLDSDDEYLPDHLELRVNFMRNNPGVDLIHGGLKVIGNPYVIDKNDPKKEIHLDLCCVGGTFFGKKDLFLDLGGFRDIPYSEDSEFLERAEWVYNVKKVDFPTYVYYKDTPGSITNRAAGRK